jgi:hypothetical protein
MATEFPFVTGEVLTAGAMNSLTAFDIGTDQTSDYTVALVDQYQKLIPMNKATAIALNIPTDASVAFPVGTVITVLNKGVGTCTISAVTPGTTSILSAGGTAASPTLAQYKTAACIKTAANVWYVIGAIG